LALGTSIDFKSAIGPKLQIAAILGIGSDVMVRFRVVSPLAEQLSQRLWYGELNRAAPCMAGTMEFGERLAAMRVSLKVH
jgi:hypothetical protein